MIDFGLEVDESMLTRTNKYVRMSEKQSNNKKRIREGLLDKVMSRTMKSLNLMPLVIHPTTALQCHRRRLHTGVP